MLELTSLLCFFFAFGLWHGAHGRRFPLRGVLPGRAILVAMQVAAIATALLGFVLWRAVGGSVAAGLVGLTATCVSATFIVVLTPLSPRLAWSLVALCPGVVLTLLSLVARDG